MTSTETWGEVPANSKEGTLATNITRHEEITVASLAVLREELRNLCKPSRLSHEELQARILAVSAFLIRAHNTIGNLQHFIPALTDELNIDTQGALALIAKLHTDVGKEDTSTLADGNDPLVHQHTDVLMRNQMIKEYVGMLPEENRDDFLQLLESAVASYEIATRKIPSDEERLATITAVLEILPALAQDLRATNALKKRDEPRIEWQYEKPSLFARLQRRLGNLTLRHRTTSSESADGRPGLWRRLRKPLGKGAVAAFLVGVSVGALHTGTSADNSDSTVPDLPQNPSTSANSMGIGEDVPKELFRRHPPSIDTNIDATDPKGLVTAVPKSDTFDTKHYIDAHDLSIKSGDGLAVLLASAGVSRTEVYKAVNDPGIQNLIVNLKLGYIDGGQPYLNLSQPSQATLKKFVNELHDSGYIGKHRTK